MKKSLNRWASKFAIVVALSFLVYSTIQLVAFALNQGAVSQSSNAIISFIISNFKTINLISLFLILLGNILIYLSFSFWANVHNRTSINIASWIFLVITTISTLKSMSLFAVPLSSTTWNILLSISYIYLAISFLFEKNKKEILLAISILYILQAIFISSSVLTIVQLAEFTIAIKVLESIFLDNLDKPSN